MSVKKVGSNPNFSQHLDQVLFCRLLENINKRVPINCVGCRGSNSDMMTGLYRNKKPNLDLKNITLDN